MTEIASKTEHLYQSAQQAFLQWCRDNNIRFPAKHEVIAKYLVKCEKSRGTSAAPVHLSAISRLYRHRGIPLDTKNIEIQKVIKKVRAKMRKN